ncbi:Rpn family recombination-promoting nuclease/putative transposase [Tepidibacter mesophilus]|uniref:Rpn family recombination-promoting nuclease/putative transposase n=1 Tax=Tepidibacter mesophilus TaxID=655607 RepID=UPI000C085D4B|nr:Rpn family recombination-promoting nuclease/putative transposase [Tepidibacter mesophilus]
MDDNINHEHDLGYKHILSHKKNFMEFLRSFVKKDWVDLIKEENLILIDKEFIQEDFKEEEADIVYKVNIDGKDIIFYILLELQSKVDFRMPIRLLMYMTEIWRDELKNTKDNIKKRKDYRLPAIIPIVLYNGKNNWTAARNFKEILNGYELFEDNIIDFRYLLFDINRMDKEELIEIANVVSSIFLLDQNVEVDEIINRLKIIGKIIKKGATKEQEKAFRSWIINIFRNRFKGEVKDNIYELLIETSKMEVDDMVSNLGKKLEEELKHREEKGAQHERDKIKKEQIERIKKALKRGYSIEIIMEILEVSVEEIEKVKEQLVN